MDASPLGAGAARARVAPGVGRELYRQADSRGHYTRLASASSVGLASLGIDAVEFLGGLPPELSPPVPSTKPKDVVWDLLVMLFKSRFWSQCFAVLNLNQFFLDQNFVRPKRFWT